MAVPATPLPDQEGLAATGQILLSAHTVGTGEPDREPSHAYPR
jgi:hypothetical protein